MNSEDTIPSLKLQITIDTARANRDGFSEIIRAERDGAIGAIEDPRHPDRIADTIIQGIADTIDQDENMPYRTHEVITRSEASPSDGIKQGRDGILVLGRETQHRGPKSMGELLVELYEAINNLPGVTARVDHKHTYDYRRTEFGRRLTDEIFPDQEEN